MTGHSAFEAKEKLMETMPAVFPWTCYRASSVTKLRPMCLLIPLNLSKPFPYLLSTVQL